MDAGYTVYSLSEFMKKFGEEDTSEAISEFHSTHASETESFLKENAVRMEKKDLSRTYIVLSDDDLTILGYITLSIKCLAVPDENLLSNTILRNMNIESRTGVAQSYLLGQLSRSTDAPKGLGAEMLDLAFDKLGSAKDLVGCRMVRLDCHDELIPYYESHGFRLITRNGNGNLNQMMAFI